MDQQHTPSQKRLRRRELHKQLSGLRNRFADAQYHEGAGDNAPDHVRLSITGYGEWVVLCPGQEIRWVKDEGCMGIGHWVLPWNAAFAEELRSFEQAVSDNQQWKLDRESQEQIK